MNNLSAIQTLACETTWRALRERNVDRTGQQMTQDTPEPDARRKIATYICTMPLAYLPRLVLPEITRHGGVANGYTPRWNDVCEAGLRFDAHKLAHGAMRTSEMEPLPEVNTSSNSRPSTHSRNSSRQTQDDDTPEAKAPGSQREYAFPATT